jgi:NAD(P) transhydrogenase
MEECSVPTWPPSRWNRVAPRRATPWVSRSKARGWIPRRSRPFTALPEIAGAGLTEEQCQAQGIGYAVGRSKFGLIPRGAIAGHGGLLKLIFRKDNQKLLGVHCIGDVASELVGIGQMVIHFGGTLSVFNQVSMNTSTYSYACKYAAFDGFRRLQRC